MLVSDQETTLRLIDVYVVDISASSVEACEGRYNSHRMIGRGARQPPFEAEFHVADCCAVSL